MKALATTRKLRGGYYTPQPIAYFLAKWAIQSPTATVLEPSCGDGNILEAAIDVLLACGAPTMSIPSLVHGVEIDETEAHKAAERLMTHNTPMLSQIHIGDFFAYCQERLFHHSRFDAIIGNPPFIRYQHFQEAHRAIAFRLMEHAGLHPTRLTNAWVPFLVASTLLLNEHGGRIGMVIPAELMQVGYAAELRRFLTDYYSKITLLTFKKLVFADIQEEVLLFLGERNDNDHIGLRIVELDRLDDLAVYEHTDFSFSDIKSMDHSKEKWTQYYLNQDEIDLLRALRADKRVTIAYDVIDVDVGIVTGLNDFFVLTDQQAKEQSLTAYTQPIVTRSGHLPGIKFTPDVLLANMDKQVPSLLLRAPDVSFDELPELVRRYVVEGQEKGFHTGYKCRIRDRWYVVPSVWRPDAFLLRQVHNYPKLVLNQTNATCTDTIHRVRFVSALPDKMVVSAFINSLTFVFAEVMGRSYGGGVLELEPNEADALPMPLQNASAIDFEAIDSLVAQGNIEAALDLTDKALLVEGLGLSIPEARKLRGAWHKLRNRRINRKHHKPD